MKRLTRSKLASATGAVLCTAAFLNSMAGAATFSWAASPATNVPNTAGNWGTATVPGINDDAFFGPSTQTALSFSANMSFFSLNFNSDAPAYTIGDVGSTASLTMGTTTPTGGNIVNNSAFTQVINAPVAFRIANINAANANIEFNGGTFNVGNNSNNNAGRNVTITGSRDVIINAQLTGTPTITGTTPNDGSTNFGQIIKTGSGTLFLNNNNNNQLFTGRITVNAGAVRGTVPNAFGANGTSGTIVLGTTHIGGGTFTGRVELAGSNAFAPETLVLEGRTVGDAGLVNFSGDNTWTGPVNLATGGDSYGISSDSGLLTISGNITNATGTNGLRNLSFRGSSNGIVSGNIVEGAGASNLSPVKSGSGTWKFTGTNTYTGATTISGGVLQIGDGGTTGSLGAGSVVNNADLVFNRADNIAVSNAISGTGNVTHAGFGALELNGALTYSGSTTVQSGTLAISTAKSGGGAVTVADGAALTLNSASPSTSMAASAFTVGGALGSTLNFSLGTTGNPTVPVVTSGALTRNGANVVNILGSNFSVGSITLVQYSGTEAGTGSFALGTLPNRVLANLLDTGSALRLNITGIDFPKWTGALNGTWDASVGASPKNWVLNSNGTTPTDFIQGDSVLFDDSSAVNSVSINGTVTPNAISFNNTSRNYTLTGSGDITGGATLTKTGTGIVTVANSGVNSFTGAITISAGTLAVGAGTTSGSLGSGTITNNAQLVLNRSDSANIANVINGSGNITVRNNSNAALSGNNGFDGSVTVQPGATLAVNSANALGSTVGSTIVQDGASLIGGAAGTVTTAAELLTIGGAGTAGSPGAIRATGGVVSTFSGPATLASNATISADGGATGVLGGVVSGAGKDLTISGGGTVALAADGNSYRNSVINQGVLSIGNGGAGGSAGTGSVAVAAGATLSFNRTGVLNFANVVSGDGALTKEGAGTVVLSSANTFTGPVTINQGAIRVTNNSAFGSGAKNIVADTRNKGIELDGGVNLPADITFSISNDGDLTQGTIPGAIHSLTGTNTINGEVQLKAGGGNGLLRVDAGGTLVVNSNITIQIGQSGRAVALGGAGNGIVNGVVSDGLTGEVMSLQVNGNASPTWTLNNANTYTGNTSLQSGTLVAMNSQAFGFGIGTFVFIGSGAAAFAGVPAGVNIGTDGITIPNMLWTNRDGAGTGAGADFERNVGFSGTTGSGTFSGLMQINGGVVFRSSAAGTLVMSGVLQNGTETIANGGNNNVYVNALGRVLFAGANTYTGFTEVDAGTLILSTASRDPILTGPGGADIHGGRMIFQYTNAADNPATTIASLLASSYATGFTNPLERFRSLNATADRGLGWLDDGVSGVTVAAAIYGDANLDGSVNLADFTRLAASFGTASNWSKGDFNYDGTTNLADFTALAAHFGQSLPAPAAQRSAVPEPVSAGLIGMTALMARRRRR